MLGAAGGIAHLLRQDPPTIRRTLGITATQTGTLSAHHGTMTKPLHGGLAPECAVFAADLAGMGFTASPIAIEGHWGYFHALGGGYDDERIRGLLGNPWTFVDRGQWLKAWPTGSLGHPVLTKMTELMHDHDLAPDQINAIRVRISESIRDVLSHDHPTSALEGKFGLPFPLATLLIEHGLGLAHFNDAFVNRPDVQETMRKVSIATYSPEEAREGNFTLVTAFLELDLANGRTIGGRIDYHKGTLANPMTDDEVADKMRECGGFAGWAEVKTEDVIALTTRLDELDEVGELMAALTPDK
jgi:2-methylcitrate dehydratase PrpD